MNKKAHYFLLFAVIIYFLILKFIGIEDILENLKMLSLPYFLISLLFVLFAILFEFIRWSFYLKELNISLDLYKNIAFFMSGFAFGFMPSKSGELIRYYFIKKEGVSFTSSVPIHFISNLTNFFVILILCSPFLFILGKTNLAIYLIFIFLILYFSLKKPRLYLNIISFLIKKFSFKPIKSLKKAFNSSKSLMSNKILSLSLLLTFLHYLCMGGALFFILQDLSIDFSFFGIFSIYLFSLVAGALSMVPGGIGIVEGGSIALLSLYMDVSLATVLILVLRFLTLWFTSFIGLIFLVISNKIVKK